jgi:hypothetical protein
MYLNDLGVEISYSECLKLLESMESEAEKKEKTSDLQPTHRAQRLNWAKSHKS